MKLPKDIPIILKSNSLTLEELTDQLQDYGIESIFFHEFQCAFCFISDTRETLLDFHKLREKYEKENIKSSHILHDGSVLAEMMVKRS